MPCANAARLVLHIAEHPRTRSPVTMAKLRLSLSVRHAEWIPASPCVNAACTVVVRQAKQAGTDGLKCMTQMTWGDASKKTQKTLTSKHKARPTRRQWTR